MSEKSQGAGLPESVEYQPLPNIYRAFAAGASPYAIVTETIDNSIDFVRRQALNGARHPDTLKVEIRYEVAEQEIHDDEIPVEDRGPGRLVIVDNAGGVPPDELARFFQLGHTDAPPQGIGRFGVGAKRLIGVGDRIKYESHAHGYEVAAGFEVDAQKLEATDDNEINDDENVYRSSVYEVEDLEEGHTRIIVEDLNENVWSNLIGRQEDGEIDESASDSLWRLGETYDHFLRNSIPIAAPTNVTDGSINFELTWSDPEHEEEVTVPDPVELSWLPFDGLHPRRYEHLPFANSSEVELENAIRADITVALMPSSRPSDAGLTVTMNNRNVLFRDSDNDLFSTRYLGKFRESQGHGRLHCVIELNGPAEDMPWSDTKDSLDGTQEVTEHLFNVAENALSEYRRQTYENLPKWILAAYGDDNLQTFDEEIRAEIPTAVKSINKSNSKVNNPRFNEKPGTRESGKYYRLYPERDTLIRQARLHSELRIRAEDVVEKKAVPAYRRYFETEVDSEPTLELAADACPSVEKFTIPLPADNTEKFPLIEDIQQLARQHAAADEVLTNQTVGTPRWLLPRYLEEFKKHGDPSSATALEEFDWESWRLQHSVSDEVRAEPEETLTATGSSIDHPTDRLVEESQQQGSDESATQRTETITPSREEEEQTAESASSTNYQSSLETSTELGSGRPPQKESQGLDIHPEQLDELRAALDVDEDASLDTIIEAAEELRDERARLIESLIELSDIVNFDALLEDPPDLEDLQGEE